MTKHFCSANDVDEYATTKSLVRSKRTSPNDDIDDTWNDDEENDHDPAVTASSTKRAVQPDPMKEALACRANIAKLKRDHYEGLYVELGRVTLIARGFDRNKKSWARFVKHSFWDKAREQDRPHVGHEKRSKIAFVTRFVFKPRTKNQFKRTSKFSGVLEFILGKGVKPENIAEELKKRRIGKIHPLVTKKPRPSGRKLRNRTARPSSKRNGRETTVPATRPRVRFSDGTRGQKRRRTGTNLPRECCSIAT
jgi:hypothetical protein